MQGGSRPLLLRVSLRFACWPGEALHSLFAARHERAKQAGTLQEPPGGDSRPQALFLRRSSSRIGGRGPRMVTPALLGLRRFGRDDPALRGCQDPARLRCHRAWTNRGIRLLCLRGQQGRDWRSFRRQQRQVAGSARSGIAAAAACDRDLAAITRNSSGRSPIACARSWRSRPAICRAGFSAAPAAFHGAAAKQWVEAAPRGCRN